MGAHMARPATPASGKYVSCLSRPYCCAAMLGSGLGGALAIGRLRVLSKRQWRCGEEAVWVAVAIQSITRVERVLGIGLELVDAKMVQNDDG